MLTHVDISEVMSNTFANKVTPLWIIEYIMNTSWKLSL